MAATSVVALMAGHAFQMWKLMQVDRTFSTATRASQQGDWTRAQPLIDAGLASAGESGHYHDAAGFLYAARFGQTGDRRQYQIAAQLFDTAHRLDPFAEYYVIHRLDLETAALQKQPGTRAGGSARFAIGALHADEWHNATAYESLARIRFADGSPAEALLAIQEAALLRGNLPRYLVLEGDISRAMGRRDDAVSAYARASGIVPAGTAEWKNAKHRLAVTLLEMNEYARAAKEAGTALSADPHDDIAQSLLTLARAH